VTRTAIAVCALVVAIGGQQESTDIPAALAAMADTERAFAAAARVKGIRDAFLEFFTDDAMFEPAAGLAKDQLHKQKPEPFSVRELVWEPRTGDVAASGELGWLTGPGTFIDHAAADKTPRYSNYLSIWRKEPDGRWRVFIDLGTRLDAPATFAPGFTRFKFDTRYSGSEGKAAATTRVIEADRALNTDIRVDGAARAYARVLAPGARVHRQGVGALMDRAAAEWFEKEASGMTAVTETGESAQSGDLAYTYGRYQLRGQKPAAYLRLWSRERDGDWRIVVDVFVR
jgi:ketosteroid isomerase-like protein